MLLSFTIPTGHGRKFILYHLNVLVVMLLVNCKVSIGNGSKTMRSGTLYN